MLNNVFDEEDGLDYVPMLMLASNSSALQGKFCLQRRTGHDFAHTYGAEISSKGSNQVIGAMGNNTRLSGYSSNDVMRLSNAPVGLSVFTKHFKAGDEAMEKILEQRSNHDRTDSAPSRFGLQESSLQMSGSDLCKKTVMEELANKMDDQDLGTTVIDLVLQSRSFQDCIKLC